MSGRPPTFEIDRALYPFSGHLFDVGNGVNLHYLDEGRGPPVVMLHGNPTWSFMYRNLVLELRDRFRCIVPDHVGCGLSDKPDETRYEYTLARRVADLTALLDHLHVTDNVTLVLHDWGGMIGMAWATQFPERVKRLVVLNTAAFPMPADAKLPRSLWWGRNTALGALLDPRRECLLPLHGRLGGHETARRGCPSHVLRPVRFVGASHRRPSVRADDSAQRA